MELYNHRRQEDLWVLEGRVELAGRLGLDTVATNHVRYHHRARRPLHDVLTAIRHPATLEEVRRPAALQLGAGTEGARRDGRALQ